MKSFNRSVSIIVRVSFLASLLSSCTATHLVYVQEATLGLSIAAGSEGTNKLSLGYDRDIYAIVPKKGEKDDAMSLFSVNRSSIFDLKDIKVSEFVATGAPASKIAEDPETVSAVREKVYGK